MNARGARTRGSSPILAFLTLVDRLALAPAVLFSSGLFPLDSGVLINLLTELAWPPAGLHEPRLGMHRQDRRLWGDLISLS